MVRSDVPGHHNLAFRTWAVLECEAYEVQTSASVHTVTHNLVSRTLDGQLFQVSEDHLV